jgi:hypothetical protein
MHTEKGTAVEDRSCNFSSTRASHPQRLVFCHVDKRPDFAFHQAIAQSGAMLEYDTFFRPKYQPEQTVWPLLEKMIGARARGARSPWPPIWPTAACGLPSAGSPAWRPSSPKFRRAWNNVERFLPATIYRDLMGGNIAHRLAYPGAVSPAGADGTSALPFL